MDTLVVAPSWVGDAVLSQPLLARLKARDPAGALDVLAPAWAFPVFRRMPEVRDVLALPFGHGELRLGERRAFAKSLPRYDRAVVLPNSLKSALVPWHAGIPERIGYRGEWRYGLITDVRVLDEGAMPLLVDRFAALAQPRGEALERPVPAPRLRSDAASLAATLAKHGLEGEGPVLALCPGAEYGPAKRWPARHFAEVARVHAARGYRVWLLGSAKDAAASAQIASLVATPVHDLAGKTDLTEALDLLSAANRVVSNDSGLMHIAAAFDRPMAALFGSSSPGYTPPLSPKARIVTLGLSCSPCFKRDCPLGHTNCLEQLEPARVMAALD
ncbi:MAG: lipopolysaccharide heptosyltransferase II [Betaproteobacteria bacterium]|nr:lipopolysaccharide heptosyltransferase II [Betaproteobacteria bacterium]